MAGESEFKIVVKVDPTQAQAGLGKVKEDLGGINDLLATIGEAVGVHALAHQALELVESYEKVQNRLRNLTDGEQDLRETTESLFKVAEETRASFNSTADVYARLARANQDVGFSQGQLLQVTKALNQEAIIQGRSSEDLTGIVGQLSIALQTGTLNARALRLIFRDFPDIAAALETQLGATSREFKKLGQEGKISGEAIFNALLGASDVIDNKFGKTVVTLDTAVVNLKTHFQEYVSAQNESLGVTSKLADGVQFAADHVNILTGAITALGVVLSGELLAKFLPKLIGGMQLVESGAAAIVAEASLLAAPFAEAAYFAVKIADENKRAAEAASGLGGELTEFGKAGLVVQDLSNKVKSLRESLADNPGDKRAAQLLDEYNAQLSEATEHLDMMSEAKKKSHQTDQQILNETKSLDDQVRILQLGTKEREVQQKLLETTQKLQQQGITLSEDQKDELTSRIRNVQALTDTAKVLTDLRGPQEEYARKVQLATQLLAMETITVQEYNRAVNSGGFAGQLDALQKETDLLKFNSQQREIVVALKEAEKAVGHELSGAQALAIVQAVQTRQELTEQSKILEEINGPQQHYADRVAALSKLLEQGKITLFDYNQALSAKSPLGPAVPPDQPIPPPPGTQFAPPTTGPLAETLAKMKEENELLALTNEERTQAMALSQAQASVGRTLTAQETAQIVEQTKAHQQLTEQLDAEQKARQTVAALQQEVLTNLQGPLAHLAGVQTQLNVLFREGKISAEEYSRGLLQVDLAARQTDTSLEGGLHRGLDKIKLQVADVAGTAEGAMVGAFNRANDALTNFVQTGKLNFDQLASSILGDIAKIALQMAENSLFSGGGLLAGLLGGGGNFGLSGDQIAMGFTGHAKGGDYPPGMPFLAGENGPEIVDPGGQGGRVIPHEQTRSLLRGGNGPVHVSPPQVHVHITNVDDPSKVQAALSSREGEKAIMNVIARNKESVRRSIQ